MKELLMDKIDFELGQILIVSDGEKLCALDFASYESRMMKLLEKRYGTVHFVEKQNSQGFSNSPMQRLRQRIRAYLAGDFSSLDEIPVSTGGTSFQQQVWLALRSIPPGTVVSYGELAKKIGKPTAYRAVGMANSLNPIGIVLPCHRVIGANASLTGYAGGLECKRWLLQHEGVELAKFVRSHRKSVLGLR